MTTLAEIVQTHGAAYQARYEAHLLPSHRRTLDDIARCRTAELGGHVYLCETCETVHYQFHSCQNRHCPQCQLRQGEVWLTQQREAMLPVPYFMVTFTLPAALQALARRHQAVMYNILFRTSAAALQELAWDPRYIGAQTGMLGVLHTWGRDLSYHPHVHYLVPAGGLSLTQDAWLSARRTFLMPVKALARLFRGKFWAALKQANLLDAVPATVWQQDWVVHCKSVGKGESALRYLAPYIFRVAIGNQRIIRLEHGQVTFRYKASATARWQFCTVSAEEFLRRFLQHVLPKGFVKVRYYGLFSPSLRHYLPVIRLWLNVPEPEMTDEPIQDPAEQDPHRCPTCGGTLRWICHLDPRSRCPPPVR